MMNQGYLELIIGPMYAGKSTELIKKINVYKFLEKKMVAINHKINNRYGQGTLKLGSEGQTESWQMKRQFLSPQYTSNWRDIPKINC